MALSPRRNLPRLLSIAVSLSCLVVKSDSLVCSCSDCIGGVDFCIPKEGGSCYLQVGFFGGMTYRRMRCYDPEVALMLCNTNTSEIVIECCQTDLCNKFLTPTLPQAPSPSSSSSSSSSSSVSPSPSSQSPVVQPSQPPKRITCHLYNSKKPDRGISYCQGEACYQLERFSSNGTITQQKLGCSADCNPENRNRAYKTCCYSDLCNRFPWQWSTTVTISTTNTIERSTTGDLPTTALPQINKSEADMHIYLVAVAILGFVYILVFFIVIGLVSILCYKQKQVTVLKQAVVTMQKNPNKSFETLTSGGDSV